MKVVDQTSFPDIQRPQLYSLLHAPGSPSNPPPPESFPLQEASGLTPSTPPQTPTSAMDRNFGLHFTNAEPASASFVPMPGGHVGHQDDLSSVSILCTCSEPGAGPRTEGRPVPSLPAAEGPGKDT